MLTKTFKFVCAAAPLSQWHLLSNFYFSQRWDYVKFMGALGSSHRHVKMSAWTSHCWLTAGVLRLSALSRSLLTAHTHTHTEQARLCLLTKTHGCPSTPISGARSRSKCLPHRVGMMHSATVSCTKLSPSRHQPGLIWDLKDHKSLGLVNQR